MPPTVAKEFPADSFRLAYPLRLEFFKSKEAKEKTASMALEWKLPHRPAELIPQRYFLSQQVPKTYSPPRSLHGT